MNLETEIIENEEDLSSAKGCIFGFLMVIPIWMIVITIIKMILKFIAAVNN